MRVVGVVTTSRADYGIYRPILKKIKESRRLDLRLFVTGAHLLKEYGNTVSFIENDGFEITAKVKVPVTDDPAGIVTAMGQTTAAFAKVFRKHPVEMLLVLGDRYEMHAAASAAVPFNIPIGHIHGGELTYGAFDEYFRHSLTKLSSLHFASTKEYAKRIEQMGESPDRIFVTGAPGLDNFNDLSFYNQQELEKEYGVDSSKPVLLITFHPPTNEGGDARQQIKTLLQALDAFRDCSLVFTRPNADTCNRLFLKEIKKFVVHNRRAILVDHFGQKGYLSVMKSARAMIGNSSSGIIEAASFALPVVNIGSRQEGRMKPRNVINVGCTVDDIRRGAAQAMSEAFVLSLKGMTNPYGDGAAAKRIVSVLEKTDLDQLKIKRFHDLFTVEKSMKKIIIIGGGGHARVLLDILRMTSCDVLGFLDKEPRAEMQVPYLGDDTAITNYPPEGVQLVNGVGSVKQPLRRREIFESFKKLGYIFHLVVHPQAVVAKDVRLEEGVQILAGSVIGTGSFVGDNVIINTKASVDHDCSIGAHTHIAPGVTLSGGVKTGSCCHVGTGANIIQGITLGDGVLVAAGETVRKDQADGVVVYSKGILPHPLEEAE